MSLYQPFKYELRWSVDLLHSEAGSIFHMDNSQALHMNRCENALMAMVIQVSNETCLHPHRIGTRSSFIGSH